jgi:hypothetical protein
MWPLKWLRLFLQFKRELCSQGPPSPRSHPRVRNGPEIPRPISGACAHETQQGLQVD